MNVKKGDVVRFLNAVGGGTVTRIDSQKGMVFVEDKDGFEVPVLERECVAVPQVNEKTNFPRKDFGTKSSVMVEEIVKPKESISSKIQFAEQIIETSEGDEAKLMLAFVPNDIRQLPTCTTTCLLINDSNYFLFYNLIIQKDGQYMSVASGVQEPNFQDELAVIPKEQLNNWEEIRMQVIPFKTGKSYTPQSVIDFRLQIPVLKLCKLHTFSENEYMKEKAWIIDLRLENAMDERALNAETLKNALLQKQTSTAKTTQSNLKAKLNPDVIEVDLHIQELTDSVVGMENFDMLQLQLKKFHEVIAENRKKHGQKIVFIHGKGEGVLRSEILKLLKTKYKSFYFQDASFREYGFGATMVVIR